MSDVTTWTEWAVEWGDTDVDDPHRYEPCLDEDVAREIARMYPDGRVVFAVVTRGPWHPIGKPAPTP